MKTEIDTIVNVLSPGHVRELNRLGIDTSNSILYWKPFNAGGKTYQEVVSKEVFPHVYAEGEVDAPTYLEAKSLLPRVLSRNGAEYFLTEISERSQTVLAYMRLGEILYRECSADPVDAVYRMIKWHCDSDCCGNPVEPSEAALRIRQYCEEHPHGRFDMYWNNDNLNVELTDKGLIVIAEGEDCGSLFTFDEMRKLDRKTFMTAIVHRLDMKYGGLTVDKLNNVLTDL